MPCSRCEGGMVSVSFFLCVVFSLQNELYVGDIILKLSSQFFDDVQEAILVVEKLSFVHSFFI